MWNDLCSFCHVFIFTYSHFSTYIHPTSALSSPIEIYYVGKGDFLVSLHLTYVSELIQPCCWIALPFLLFSFGPHQQSLNSCLLPLLYIEIHSVLLGPGCSVVIALNSITSTVENLLPLRKAYIWNIFTPRLPSATLRLLLRKHLRGLGHARPQTRLYGHHRETTIHLGSLTLVVHPTGGAITPP